MAAPPSGSKQTSRWGSFLQQAVAGVESRLDTILADGDDNQSRPKPEDSIRSNFTPSKGSGLTGSTDGDRKANEGPQRTSSNNRSGDRLQERLARAVVNKSTTGKSTSAVSSVQTSRTGSPTSGLESPRGSSEAKRSRLSVEIQPASLPLGEIKDEGSTIDTTPSEHEVRAQTSLEPESAIGESVYPEMTRDFSNDMTLAVSDDSADIGYISPAEVDHQHQPFEQSQADDSESTAKQEEIHSYIERIDALQSKLRYLSGELAETARKAAIAAPVGSLEKKLAEKDEQIALLMEEGQKLSKNELRHMTTIKQLRLKLTESEKGLTDGARKQEKADRAIIDLRDKLRRAELAERRAQERLKAVSRIEQEVENLKAERESNQSLLASLRTQLAEATTRADEVEARAQTEALETERKVNGDLREEISNGKIERELAEERLKVEIRTLKDKLERQQERSRAMELELRGEQTILESKLESLRAQAEEVSSGATGDSQAKLLRQIETLQRQYNVASENWQGIEGSLLSRISHLEKERDEVAKRESEIRRRARESHLRLRSLEEELEDRTNQAETLQQNIAERDEQLKAAHARLDQVENSLKDVRSEFEREKVVWESRSTERIKEERRRWQEENLPATGHSQASRADSPILSNRKPSGSDLFGGIRRVPSRQLSSEASNGQDRAPNRRPSPQTLRSFEHGSIRRQDSSMYLPTTPLNGSIPESLSMSTPDRDESLDGIESSLSPHRTIHDVISTSTIGAGPSVQLVERMSAAVRRLESEKAASKDEMARLLSQRDEARAEIVLLMREVEQKRSMDDRIHKLEHELIDMNERYQTTLEMLGEKSEMVEELQADIADVKKIYRELLDNTMK